MVKRRAPRGFTLVEVLVALMILVIGILGVVQILVPGMRTITKAKYQRIATNFADAELNQMKKAFFLNITSAKFPSPVTVSGLPGSNQATVTIAPYPNSDSTKLKRVTIDVTWPGDSFVAGSVHFDTLFAFDGL